MEIPSGIISKLKLAGSSGLKALLSGEKATMASQNRIRVLRAAVVAQPEPFQVWHTSSKQRCPNCWRVFDPVWEGIKKLELNDDMKNSPICHGLAMLIVDDEPNVCFTLKLIFEQEGYRVATAASASDGIKALEDGGHFDLVLTDLHMEREDAGFDLARVAKKLEPPPIVIVVTGYASVKNARTALDVQVDHFAIKPIEIPDFLEAVRRLAGWRSDARHNGG